MGECGGVKGSLWVLWVMGSRLFGSQDDPTFFFPWYSIPLPDSFSYSSQTLPISSFGLSLYLFPYFFLSPSLVYSLLHILGEEWFYYYACFISLTPLFYLFLCIRHICCKNRKIGNLLFMFMSLYQVYHYVYHIPLYQVYQLISSELTIDSFMNIVLIHNGRLSLGNLT